jgi:hypothetical protein
MQMPFSERYPQYEEIIWSSTCFSCVYMFFLPLYLYIPPFMPFENSESFESVRRKKRYNLRKRPFQQNPMRSGRMPLLFFIHMTEYDTGWQVTVILELQGVAGMVNMDRCASFVINPMRLSCRRDWASKMYHIFQFPFLNTHRARRPFSPPRTFKRIH